MAGGFDTGNLGDYASFAGLVNILGSKGLRPEFVHFSRHPRDAFGREFPFVKNISNLDWDSSSEAEGKMLRGFNRGDSGSQLSVIAQEIASSDVLLIGNGRLLTDYSLGQARGPLPYFALLSALAKVAGVPYVVWSMTLIEPSTERGHSLLQNIICGASFLFLRDLASAQIAIRLGASASNVRVVPDFAWAMTPTPSDSGRAQNEGVRSSRGSLRVGVNFRGVSGELEVSIAQNARFISRIANSARLTGVAQQHYDDPGGPEANDDRVNFQVFKALGLEPKGINDRILSLAEICDVYDSLDVLVTTRRHGMILAASRSLPSILWASEENTERALDQFPVRGVVGVEPDPLELDDLDRAIATRDAVAKFSRTERDTLFRSVAAEELLGFR